MYNLLFKNRINSEINNWKGNGNTKQCFLQYQRQ